jgi:hypothetical protein
MTIKITPLAGEEVLISARKVPENAWKLIALDFAFLMLLIVGFCYSNNQYVFMFAILVSIFFIFVSLTIYLLWHNNILIISNKRVVNVDKRGLFSHEFSEHDLRDILRVSYTQKGLSESFFRTGTVTMYDIHGSEYSIYNISNPKSVQETVSRIIAALNHSTKN